jgi:hypothetical protein
LRDGRKVATNYTGNFPTGQARPLALASADFDEDGMPDLASGFAAPDGTGIVTIHRGNVDALWPYGDAIRHGEPPAFLPDARVFTLPTPPDFLGAGDFDADGHWDIVAATLGGKTLYLLRGDGHGGFSAPEAIGLPGAVTAFTTGEMNRADGLTDIAVGVSGDKGSQVLVFESPWGALRDMPEEFPMPATVTALAMMPLDDGHFNGLAVGAGNQLLEIHGRDRKLSYPKAVRDGVAAAEITRQTLPFAVWALAAGRFTSTVLLDLAALGDDGKVHFLERPDADYQAARAALPVSIGGRNGLAAMRPGTAEAKPLPKKPEGREMVLRDEVAMPPGLVRRGGAAGDGPHVGHRGRRCHRGGQRCQPVARGFANRARGEIDAHRRVAGCHRSAGRDAADAHDSQRAARISRVAEGPAGAVGSSAAHSVGLHRDEHAGCRSEREQSGEYGGSRLAALGHL